MPPDRRDVERGDEGAARARRRPVCVFLVPLVRDSDRRSHPPILWRLLEDALIELFEGLGGPETVLFYKRPEPVSGLWSPELGETPVEDRSRKYTVAVDAGRVEELRALLRRAGNSFDQRVMYLEVAGYAELLDVRPQDGFLEV
jgi:hypothetical protein